MCGRLCLHNDGKLQRSLPQIMFLDRLYTPRQVVEIVYDFPKSALQRRHNAEPEIFRGPGFGKIPGFAKSYREPLRFFFGMLLQTLF